MENDLVICRNFCCFIFQKKRYIWIKTVNRGVVEMKVKAGSWSMLRPEEKLLLLTVISNQSKKKRNSDQ